MHYDGMLKKLREKMARKRRIDGEQESVETKAKLDELALRLKV